MKNNLDPSIIKNLDTCWNTLNSLSENIVSLYELNLAINTHSKIMIDAMSGEAEGKEKILTLVEEALGEPTTVLRNGISENTTSHRSYVWLKENIIVKVNSNAFNCCELRMIYNSLGETIAQGIIEKFPEYIPSKEDSSLIYVPFMQGGSLTFESLGSGGKELERGNYSEEVLEGFDLISRELSKKNPAGRLSIFQGPPGTGKSYLVKGLFHSVKNTNFILISPDMVSSLGDPSFLPALVEHRACLPDDYSITLLVEDADKILLPRGNDNLHIISSLLNFADGIIGERVDVRIVCTTNADIDYFDEAITRPGRLLTNVKVGRLSPDKAKKVYERISGESKTFDTSATLAEIYAIKNGVYNFSEKKTSKVGF